MKLHQLDLNLLLAFDALMTERNVTRAAQQLYISQPAMSHALNRLRQFFADPLLVRTPQGMMPSPRALKLHTAVRQALLLLEQQFGDEEQFIPAESSRRFVISTTDYVECVLIPPLISRLKQLNPGITVLARAHSDGEVRHLLQHGADGAVLAERELAHSLAEMVMATPPYRALR